MFWIEIASSQFQNQTNIEKTKIVVIGCGVSFLAVGLSTYFVTRQMTYVFLTGLVYIAITSFGLFKGAKMLSVRLSEGLIKQKHNINEVHPEPENSARRLSAMQGMNAIQETCSFYSGQQGRFRSSIHFKQTDEFGEFEEKQENGRAEICGSESSCTYPEMSLPIFSSTLQRQTSVPLPPKYEKIQERKGSVPFPHRFQKIQEHGRILNAFNLRKNIVYIQSASVNPKLQNENRQVPPEQKNCTQLQRSQKDEQIITAARSISLWLATLFLSSIVFVVTLNYPVTGALTCICAFCMILSVLLIHLQAISYLTPKLSLQERLQKSMKGCLPLKAFIFG